MDSALGYQGEEDSSLTSRQDFQGDKVIHAMRHGQTEMNVFLQFNEQARMGQLDPKLYDTKLTYRGKRQAELATAQVTKLDPAPQLLVVSPLSRALCTAELAFNGVDCPRMVQPLARERLYYSSDVGQLPAVLQRQWPMYDFSELEPIWWYSDGSNDPTIAIPEPNEVFLYRVYELYRWLQAQPQQSIALVAHHGVLKALTGIDFDNCQMISMNLSDFPIEAYMNQLRSSIRNAASPEPPISYRHNASQLADDLYDDPATGDVLAHHTVTHGHQPLTYVDSTYGYGGTSPHTQGYDYDSLWGQPGAQYGLGLSPMRALPEAIPQPRFYSQGSMLRAVGHTPGHSTPPQPHSGAFAFGYAAGVTSDPLATRQTGGFVEAPYAGQYGSGIQLRAHSGSLYSLRQQSLMSRQSSTTSFMGY